MLMVLFSLFVGLCRKILSELSSDTPAVPKIEEEEKVEEDTPASSSIATVTVPSSIYQTSSGQYSTSPHTPMNSSVNSVLCLSVLVLQFIRQALERAVAFFGV